MGTILVTGGAGFIGSNFIRFWMMHYPQDRVINLDKLTYAGNPDNLIDLASDPRYHFVHGDVCDVKAVEPLAKQADVIVNFAAETHVDRSILNPADFVLTATVPMFFLRLPDATGIDCTYKSAPMRSTGASMRGLPRKPHGCSQAVRIRHQKLQQT